MEMKKMNDFLRISILLFLISFSCTAQKQSIIKNFDIETFEKNKIEGEYNFILDDGTKIRQISGLDDYVEYRIPLPPEVYETSNQYLKTGELKSSIISFPERFVKSKKEFNQSGELIEEINYDLPVSYTHLTLPTIYSV